MPQERSGAVTLGGNPMTLVGPEITVGDKAPNFNAIGADMSELSLASAKGKVRLFLSVTSLDTLVCDTETKKFSEMAANFPDNVEVFVVSVDLPFAQKRWCGAADVDNIKTASDHRDVSFGKSYGTLVKEIRQLSRAVFVVDQNDTVQYVQYVPEIGQEPDYETAADAVKKIAG